MTENGEDQADDDQDDPDRDQDRQLRHQKANHEQNDAQDNHPARLPRHSETNMGDYVRTLPLEAAGRSLEVSAG